MVVVVVVVVSNWYVVVAIANANDLMPLLLSCDWLQIVQLMIG